MKENLLVTSYLSLPEAFYEKISPKPVLNPRLLKFNDSLAETLNLPKTCDELCVQLFAGNWVPKSLVSLALAYAGHQFGTYVPLLGDGRAIILGEVTDKENRRIDIQLKGSGKTSFSRLGDGRAPLSAVLREYLVSEAMYGLGIPTTRSLAAIETEEVIYRQEGLVPMGVLTRVAASHIRVGSFQYAMHKGKDYVQKLADYVIERHFPECKTASSPYCELFQIIVDRQAKLIAEWMSVGFIHGVMNTDNMSIVGETIDYGPCAFMDEFDVNTVYSSIDAFGRYRFMNQPVIAHWNLAQLGTALLAITKQDELQDLLNFFPQLFKQYWNEKMRLKLGLKEENSLTEKVMDDFIQLLQEEKIDFTNTFRSLADLLKPDSASATDRFIVQFKQKEKSTQWVRDWKQCIFETKVDILLLTEQMNKANPAYIPRNHLIEKAIRQYLTAKDLTLINHLLEVFQSPYKVHSGMEFLQALPKENERVFETFCGT